MPRKIIINKISFILLALLGLVLLAGSYFRILESYELQSLDLRFNLRPPIVASDDIILIEIGDDTIQKLGRFPLNRSYHALITKALAQAGARMIVFDFFFSEPQEHDKDFEDAISGARNVYLPVVFDLDPEKSYRLPMASGYAARNIVGIESVARGLGHINVIPDIDGKFRKVPTYIKYGEKLTPYLSILMGRDYLGLSDKEVKILPGRFIDLGNGVKLPIDEYSNIIVNYSGKWDSSYKHYSYVDILQSYLSGVTGGEPSIDLKSLKGKVCIIGLSAVGTVDLHPNPFEPLYPAMGIHAEVFNSIVTNNFIRRTSKFINIFILLVVSFIILLTVSRARPLGGLLILSGIAIIFVLSCMMIFNFFGLWLDMVYPIIVMVFIYIFVTLYKYMSEWRNRLIIENELNIAKKIQESFLPKVLPEIESASIVSAMWTARQVGGDLYDFISFENKKLGVMIGDVSGKGIPASLFMAMAVSAFKSFALSGAKPKDVLSELNKKLIRESSSDLFVTMYYAVFDFKDKTFIYSNGGHLPVLHIDKDGIYKFIDVSEGAPLGLIDGLYNGGIFNFKSGDIFIFYTDGITEAMNKNEDMYGRERLIEIVLKNRYFSSEQILKAIEHDIRSFESQLCQHDDITIIIIKTG